MSFQGYLNTIKEKTGLGPVKIRQKAAEIGFTENGQLKVKAGDSCLAKRRIGFRPRTFYGYLCAFERNKK